LNPGGGGCTIAHPDGAKNNPAHPILGMYLQ